MDNSKLKVYTSSDYDSGTFCGFSCGLLPEDVDYGVYITLDKVLTKQQIRSIELTINCMVNHYLREVVEDEQ